MRSSSGQTGKLVESFLKELAAAKGEEVAQLRRRPANEFPESVENFGLEREVEVILERNEQIGIVAWKQEANAAVDECPMFQLTDDGQCGLRAGNGRDLVELITTIGDDYCWAASAEELPEALKTRHDGLSAPMRAFLDGLRTRLGLGQPNFDALAGPLTKGQEQFGSVNLFEPGDA